MSAGRDGIWSVCVATLALSACRCTGSDLETELGTVVVHAADSGPPPQVTTTGCWAAPIVLSGALGSTGDITVLPSGAALVAWNEPEGLFSRVLFLDGGMSGTSTLDRPLVDDPLEESLELVQLAGHEAPAALWVHRRDAGASRELLLARFDLDAGWQPVERLDEAPFLEAAEVGVDRFGQITAKWQKRSGSLAEARLVARRSNGSGWFDAEVLSPPNPMLGNSILRVGTDGLAVVGWYGYYAPTFEGRTHASVWTLGMRADAIVSTGEATAGFRSLAVEGDRAVMVAGALPNDRRLELARFNGGSWASAEVDAGGMLWSDPNVGFNQAHQASGWVLVLSFGGGSQYWLGTTVETDAGWAPLALDPLAGTPQNLRVVGNENGSVIASWADDLVLLMRRFGQPTDDVLRGLDPYTRRLSVGPSGATWLLASERPESWRLLALPCR